ncbi:MAG: energy-coupling factor ABC transporter ATP-binding protein [Desulfomonilaceae bacterium]
MIRIENLAFSYSPSTPLILNGLTLTIRNLSWVVLTGPDGSGKTTLGKIISGLLKPHSGSVQFNPPQDDQSLVVAYLGGDPYDSMVGISIEEDIIFGLENMELSSYQIEIRLRQALRWTGLAGMEKRLVHTLSGGEQQKVALAAALAVGCRVIVIDEALNMLDRPIRLSIRSLLGSLRATPGLTVIEVTHNLQDALTAERILFLARGTILFDGTAAEFLGSPDGSRWASLAGGVAGLRSALVGRRLVSAYCGDNSELSSCLLNMIGK